MNSQYNAFLDLKTLEQENKKLSRGDLTLECYRQIGEMLDEGIYDDFVDSVKQFIEEKEYVTDKQYEIIDRIYRHRHDN